MYNFTTNGFSLPAVYNSATLNDNLEHSGGISISWNSASADEIPLGAYITYEGTRYILLEPYKPEKASAIHWQYSPTFKHPVNMLDRVPFWLKTYDSQGHEVLLRNIKFTGYAYTIAQKLASFFSDYVTETSDTFFSETFGTWTTNLDNTSGSDKKLANTYITVNFDGCSIKSAAQEIAQALGCNVFFDWTAKCVRFVAGTTIEGHPYNYFHVLGGTKNMSKLMASGSYAALIQRLTLPSSSYPGSIYPRPSGDDIRLIEDLTFDDIYPKMELYVKSVRERLCYLTDEDGARIIDHWEKNGATVPEGTQGATAVYKLYSKWYVRLATDPSGSSEYTFDPSKLIENKTLGILFQPNYDLESSTSALTSREFDLVHFNRETSEWEKDDVLPREHPFKAQEGEYRIVFTADGDIILPTTSDISASDYLAEVENNGWVVPYNTATAGMFPHNGNKVTLLNMAMGEAEKATAQAELLDAAQEAYAMIADDKADYSFQLIGTIPSVGSDYTYEQYSGVVKNVSLNIDTTVATITIGTWKRSSMIQSLKDNISYVKSNGDGVDSGERGISSAEIDALYQTIRKPDTLFKCDLGNEQDSVPCTYDGKAERNVDIMTDLIAFYGTKDIVGECTFTFSPANSAYTVHQEATKNGRTGTALTAGTSYPVTDGDTVKKWLRFRFTQGESVDDRMEVTVTITHPTYGSQDYSLTILGVRAGNPGEHAVIYQLLPSAKSINVGRTASGGYTPERYNLFCGYTKSAGMSIVTVPDCQGTVDDTYRIYFSLHSRATDTWSSYYWYNKANNEYKKLIAVISGVANSGLDVTAYDKVHFVFYKETVNDSIAYSSIDRNKVFDNENVGVVSDGMDGIDGAPGGNTATLMLYSRTKTTVDWTNTLTYTFATKSLNQVPTGWMLNQIPSGTDPIYVTAATAYSTAATDTIAASEWSAPVKMVENGGQGEHGVNTAAVFLYQRGATAPAKPTAALTYTFATGALNGTLAGWSQNIPATNGNPCWVIQATAVGTGTTDSIAASEWSTQTKLVEDGTDGIDGTSPWLATTSNEITSVACDLDGNPTSAQTVSTNVSMFQGSTRQSIMITGVTRNGTAYVNGTAKNGVTVSWGTSAATQLTVSVDYATTAVISGKDDFAITIKSGTETQVVHLIVNGLLPGATGASAVIYELVPSHTVVIQKKDSSRVPAATTRITCAVEKTVGSTTTTAPTSEYTLKYSLNGGTEAAYSSGILVSQITSGLAFILYDKSGNALDRQTIPLITDGADGAPGPEGPAGKDAYSCVVTPATIIFTQNIETKQLDSPKTATIVVKKGNSNDTVSFSLTIGTKSNVGTVTASGGTVTVNGVANGSTSGYVNVSVAIANGPTFTITIAVLYNLLGTWQESIENGMEQIAADRIEYAITNEGLLTTTSSDFTSVRDAAQAAETWVNQVNTPAATVSGYNQRIANAEGNITTVSKSIQKKNLFESLAWVLNDGSYPPAKIDTDNYRIYDDGNFDMLSPIVSLPVGDCVFSAYVPSQRSFDTSGLYIVLLTGCSVYDRDGSGTVNARLVGTVSGDTKEVNGETYYRRYAVFRLTSASYCSVNLNGYDTYFTDVVCPKIETGDTPTLFSIDSTSVIAQTAENIRAEVGQTGVDIANGKIDLYADKIRFYKNKASAQSSDPAKVWIDGDNGTIHAVDGIFEGSLYYHKVLFLNSDVIYLHTNQKLNGDLFFYAPLSGQSVYSVHLPLAENNIGASFRLFCFPKQGTYSYQLTFNIDGTIRYYQSTSLNGFFNPYSGGNVSYFNKDYRKSSYITNNASLQTTLNSIEFVVARNPMYPGGDGQEENYVWLVADIQVTQEIENS